LFFFVLCTLYCQFLCMDCAFLIAPSVFSNIYFIERILYFTRISL
jgi:hypothetical protein